MIAVKDNIDVFEMSLDFLDVALAHVDRNSFKVFGTAGQLFQGRRNCSIRPALDSMNNMPCLKIYKGSHIFVTLLRTELINTYMSEV